MRFRDVSFHRYVEGKWEDTGEALYALPAGDRLHAIAEMVRKTSPETEDWEVQKALSWVRRPRPWGGRFEKWLNTTPAEQLAEVALRDL